METSLQEQSEAELCRLWEELEAARRLGDKLAKAAALRAIVQVLRELKRFDEAISCCRQHATLCAILADPREQQGVLYNLATVHHARGKHLLLAGGSSEGRAIRESRIALRLAAHYYKAHLWLTHQLQQRAAEGRTLGHLGNVFSLLGNFATAHKYLAERLNIAYELGDLNAQRRVCTNLANTYVLEGNLTQAAAYHCVALEVAIRMKNKILEAQCYFSLACTHLMACNYRKSMDNLKKHLELAQKLQDEKGMCCCYWAMGKALIGLGKLDSALICATHHLNLASKLHREDEAAIAKKNVADLGKALATQYKSPKKRPLSHTCSEGVHWRRIVCD